MKSCVDLVNIKYHEAKHQLHTQLFKHICSHQLLDRQCQIGKLGKNISPKPSADRFSLSSDQTLILTQLNASLLK